MIINDNQSAMQNESVIINVKTHVPWGIAWKYGIPPLANSTELHRQQRVLAKHDRDKTSRKDLGHNQSLHELLYMIYSNMSG